ncbi:hypothetical protein [Burkholderia stagnalis]|uniref:hypothetical protein n=1 Tax=Burkholderia stagnalis TaxID=1503054 RepID=UPI0021AB42CC|nr:hypothetical protein [Burkholderia stagnalis]
MAQSQLTLIECRPEALDGERLREIRAALDDDPAMRVKTDTSGGTVGADEAAGGGAFFRVYADGAPVAWYVLTERRDSELCIALAFGRAHFDLVEHVLPLIERQCATFGGLWIETKRRGLAKKLRAAGYREVAQLRDGVQLRKAL